MEQLRLHMHTISKIKWKAMGETNLKNLDNLLKISYQVCRKIQGFKIIGFDLH